MLGAKHDLHIHFLAVEAFLASIILRDLLLFLRNFGSHPFKLTYLCLVTLVIPFLCAFALWLWAVWFVLFAIVLYVVETTL